MSIHIENYASKDLILIGLYFKCPVYQENNPCNCQMYSIRKTMKIGDFREYLSLLSDEEKDKMLNNHFTCVNNQLK
jgi:hypothetical protein